MASQGGREPRARHVSRALLLLAGVALGVFLVWKTGWAAVEANLASIGWWFFGLTALYLLAEIAFVLGWRAVMDPRPPLTSLPGLLRIYLAGNSLNYLAPGSVAGEPLRANMLRERLGTSSAIASVAIFKHAHMLSQALFVASGLAIAVVYFDLPAAVRWAALASVVVLVGLLVLMTWALQKGTFAPILSFLSRFKPLARRLERYQEGALQLDDRIKRFYVDRRPHFFSAAGWCLLGWCGGLLETYIVLRLLAPGRGWETACAIESLAMLLNNMFLFVPGRAGTAEGVRTGVFVLLGLPASTGVAYGLVRRARELMWVLPGLAFISHPPAASLAPDGVGASPKLAASEQSR
jgi:glycosyltransferase 2 family protein